MSSRLEPYYLYLFSGPLVFAAIVFGVPDAVAVYAARGAFATLAWMTLWWIFRPIHIGVTSLLPIVVNAVFGFVDVAPILVNYASPIMILLLGANIITVSWHACGLDKRIALRALCMIGPSVRQQTIVWFTISVVLTIFLPNTVVAAVLIPIAISMLSYAGLGEQVSESKVATVILLAIAWGAGLGGFGSPLGGAMNLVSIQYLEEMVLHREYMYLTWTLRMLPILVILSALVLWYLLRLKVETTHLAGSKEFFVKTYRKLAPMSRAECWSLALFLLASFLAFARPLYDDLLPAFKPPYAFLLCGMLTFIVPGNGGKRLTTWEYTGPRLMWGLFYLFAGGIALGKFLAISGAADLMTQSLTGDHMVGGFLTVAVFVVLGMALCNVTSDTAACAILVPIVIDITQAVGLNPVPYVYVASVASNCAYILPTSVRAIPVGYGLDPKVMFNRGIIVLLLSFVAVTLLGYVFVTYVPWFAVA